MENNQFSLPELKVIYLALEDLVNKYRRLQSAPGASDPDRNQIFDALKASRSARKKIGLLIQAAEKDLETLRSDG